MTKIMHSKSEQFGIVQLQEDGTIIQIGLTESQYLLFESFLSVISKEKPLVKLPKEYNLTHSET